MCIYNCPLKYFLFFDSLIVQKNSNIYIYIYFYYLKINLKQTKTEIFLIKIYVAGEEDEKELVNSE